MDKTDFVLVKEKTSFFIAFFICSFKKLRNTFLSVAGRKIFFYVNILVFAVFWVKVPIFFLQKPLLSYHEGFVPLLTDLARARVVYRQGLPWKKTWLASSRD